MTKIQTYQTMRFRCEFCRKSWAAAETSRPRTRETKKEWTDVAILALDGLWREIAYGQDFVLASREAAQRAVLNILAKHDRNELRDWPDWRAADPDKAIEHIRSASAQIATPEQGCDK